MTIPRPRDDTAMRRSPIAKRSISIGRHKTSVSLEHGFWDALKLIATAKGQNVSQLIATIDEARQHGNLSSALRVFVLTHYQEAAAGQARMAPASEPAVAEARETAAKPNRTFPEEPAVLVK